MSEAASIYDGKNLVRSVSYNLWDHDMIYGCICDEGWEGYDCSLKSCPKGDDPLTSGIDEVQLIECTADGGTIAIEFRGEYTARLPFSVTAGQLEYELEKLSSIDDITVEFYDTAGTLCEVDGGGAKVTFTNTPGDVQDFTIYSSGLTISVGSVAATVLSGEVKRNET